MGIVPLIKKCFQIHSDQFDGKINFTWREYFLFWLNHNVGDDYVLKHRNGKTDKCKVGYYPLPYYSDLRALIEIKIEDGIDFREVPVAFLEKSITQ